jgi:hypothetical protein
VIWQNDLLTYVGESGTSPGRRAERTLNNTPQTTDSFEMNVVRFRPRDAAAFAAKRALDASTDNICDLLDLSRYELSDRSRNDSDLQKDGPDDFEHRMRANIAALIFLVALVGLAATDVLKLAAHVT